MSRCRAAVYLWFGVAAAFTAWFSDSSGTLTNSLPVVGGLLLGACWSLLYVALQCGYRRRLLWVLHLADCAVLMFCAKVWAFSLAGGLWLLAIVLAANTALWGWRRLLVFMPAAALGYGSGYLAAADSSLSWQATHPWLDAWLVCGGMAFMLAICAVAHNQAQLLLGISRHLRAEKHTLLRYLPSDLPDQLQDAVDQGVRREWMSVVFIDLVGFTRATDELPPEALIEFLNRFIAQVDIHVESWGGHVSKFLGDGVLCVFPAPSDAARGNVARQAVRCVGLLPRVLAGLNQQWRAGGHAQTFAVSCGVASGYCCAGHWGGNRRLDYTAIGAPVNLAQRLQSVAGEHGGVLLDETTRALIDSSNQLRVAASVLSLKGLGSVPAYPLAQIV